MGRILLPMKRKIFLALGVLLATAIVSGSSIVLYERFGRGTNIGVR